MGVDYFRCSIKPGTDREHLDSLAQQQAIAFQSNPRWQGQSQACSDFNNVPGWLMEHLHGERYVTASKALRELLAFPEWNDEEHCAKDFPELIPCMRVYRITYNPVFPPLWRMRAYQTIFPDQLPIQIAKWKEWTEQVTAGEHMDYVRRLHMFHDTDFARYHWGWLRGNACAYDGKEGDATFDQIRREIIMLPEPGVSSVPVDASDRKWFERDVVDAEKDEQIYPKVLSEIRQLIELTRAWNRHVPKKSWRVTKFGYDGDYYASLDDFKKKTIEDGSLREFYDWADKCVEHGFGFFLDY